MKTIILYSLSFLILVITSFDYDNSNNQDNSKNVDSNKLVKKENIDAKVLTSKFGKLSEDSWGIGIISNKKHNNGEILNFPNSTISIYDKPNGEIIGIIYRETGNGYDLLIENHKTKIVNKINRKDYIEVTYEGKNLKYYKVDNGFINCFIHSIDNGIWIKKDDLENLNFTPICWKDFLIVSEKKMHPPHNTSIALFDNTGQFVDSLKYGDFEIILMDNKVDNLIKVEIYNPSVCAGGDGKKIREAWIELIDKNGHPNVFYYTRGC